MAYATDGKIGVDFTKTTAGTGTSNDEGGLHALGERVIGTDGTVWCYVHASGAITQYDAVAIDENFEAAALTDALAGAGHMIGFAQVAFADNDFGWVAIEGTNIRARCATSCVADGNLWSYTVSGVLDDASSAGAIEIHGVTTVTSVGAATAAVEIIARAPYATHTDL